MQRVVIVGASLAGVRTAEALRAAGYQGSLMIVGGEAHLPYDRPPLSKGFLEGKRTEEQLTLSPSNPSFSHLDAELRLGAPIVSSSFATGALQDAHGSTIEFDGLVIATGARLRRLDAAPPGAFGLRTLDDAQRLQSALKPGQRVVIIGAGFIGAEVASTAATLGCTVTVIEAMHIPLSRQLGDAMGQAVSQLHESNGVTLHAGAQVASMQAGRVDLADGTALDADVIVVGVGVIPNVEWLANDQLDLQNGVLCDEALRVLQDGQPLPNVVAVGDVARWTNNRYAYEGPVRVEHWTNAVESAQHAAATLLGDPQPFTPVPYFWSDQYGKKIQFLGRSSGFDEVRVVAGSPADGKWLALYRRGDQLVAALGVSQIKALMTYRQPLIDGCTWGHALELAPKA
jgi:NADPH-dependent 2,4-dienoyl-CoA reductase/sulfur reductase-like enzyme